MVEKRFSDTLRLQIKPKSMNFSRADNGLSVSYDEKLLQKHLPLIAGLRTSDRTLAATLGKYIPDDTVDALKSTEFVNVHGRVVKENSTGRICLQYLYVWDYQAVPVHEADYEPVFVYLDGNQRYAIYDLVHYCTRRLDLGDSGEHGPGLRVIPGWHSFLPDTTMKLSDTDSTLTISPLSDQHLDSWWGIPDDAARLKIDGHLRNPFRLAAPGHFLDNPDEEARTMCCTFKEIESALHEFNDPKVGIIEGLKRAFSRCVGIFALHRLAIFLKLLTEMNDVGMITVPSSLRNGLNLGTIGQVLQDGFVSITKKGSDLFQGWGATDADHDDE
ncbi:MAG: hypothetical protein P1Q69_05575 [Candidatus Thorarchaeota archaeon]|nr:hypothetical protein [Candidatus Thorarchaeota archaeon]